MSDFVITAPARKPVSIRFIRNVFGHLGAAMRIVSEAWANRPRFQTYHEMVAGYEPEGRISRKERKARKAQPFSNVTRLHLPNWY